MPIEGCCDECERPAMLKPYKGLYLCSSCLRDAKELDDYEASYSGGDELENNDWD
jgi:hypothetical protein